MTRSRDVADIDGLLTAKGDIYAATAAATPARLAVGANDTILTADSTAATGMKWAAAGGGLTQIGTTTTLSGTTTTIALIPSGYKYLLVIVEQITISADAYVTLRPNGATTGFYAVVPKLVNSTSSFDNNVNQAVSTPNAVLATGGANSFVYTIYNYDSASGHKPLNANGDFVDDSTAITALGWIGSWRNTAAISSITMGVNTGNFTGGTMRIFGAN
jgi:hypothetical protein